MNEGRNLVPKRRFKEFEYADAWELRKLGDLYTERNERGDNSLKILSVSIHHGVSNNELDSDELGKNVRRSKDKSLYKHVYPGDLIFNMMRAWQGGIGVTKSEGMVSPAYITAVPSDELYPIFMDYSLRREATIFQMNNLSYGVTDFRKRLYWDSFVRVTCSIPSVPEQECIAHCLQQFDNLITLHQRKLDKVKAFKESCLVEMFPAEGERKPKRRFPGFTDAWEQRKLGQLGKCQSGIGFSEAEQGGTKGVPFYKVSDMNNTGNENVMQTANNYVSIEQNKIRRWNPITEVPAIIFAKVGAAIMLNRKRLVFHPFLIDNNTMAYIFDKTWDIDFGKTLFDTIDLSSLAQTGALPSYNAPEVEDVEIKIPSLPEQKQIGTFFHNLDNLITLHQRKLDKLKAFKEACLTEMFV